MRGTRTLCLAGCAASLLATSTVLADTNTDVNLESMKARLAELEARDAQRDATIQNLQGELNRVRAQSDDNWLTEQRSEEIRGIVNDVLADADSRASLLQSGSSAGWNNGFFLQSADGNFRLNLKGMIQFRYVGSHQDDSGGDDHRGGFEHSRTRFSFGGHVVDPSWKYFIWGGWNNSGGALLLDAWVQKDLGNGWKIKAGQFKLPVWQEWTVSETRQQFVERSNLDARFGSLYSQGIMAAYGNDNMRASITFSDGLRTLNTPFGVAPTGGLYDPATEFAFTGRVEFLLNGSWANYADFNSFNGDDAMTVIGASVHYQDGESGTGVSETEVIQYTIDASMEFGGANLYIAGIGSDVDNDGLGVSRTEYGVLVQGGVFVTDEWELIGRFEWGDLDGAGGTQDDLSILTLGATRYWNKHGLKWTTDVGYGFDEVSAVWGGAGRGWRGDAVDEDGQLVFRSQLQLLF